MSAMKRFIEDVGQQVHIGDRETIEDLLGSWSAEDKVNILLEAISWAAISAPDCDCLGHKLKAYRESNDREDTNEQSAAECLHNYGVEKGISFCLDCGEFEDFLAKPEEKESATV